MKMTYAEGLRRENEMQQQQYAAQSGYPEPERQQAQPTMRVVSVPNVNWDEQAARIER